MSVTHFRPQSSYPGLRRKIFAYICACCWIEAVEHLTSEAHDESHELFETALAVLQELNEAENTRNSCKILCNGFEEALKKTGFGSEHGNRPDGFNKMQALARRIEEISCRTLRSWPSVVELVQNMSLSERPAGDLKHDCQPD